MIFLRRSISLTAPSSQRREVGKKMPVQEKERWSSGAKLGEDKFPTIDLLPDRKFSILP